MSGCSLVPALTLLITVPLTLLAVGPVANWISDIIGGIFMAVHDFSPVLTGALVGGLWQVLVVFGLHQGIVPIQISNLMNNGFENVICCMQAVPFTTCAVVLAVCIKTRSKKIREAALPAAISSFFGVSEPSIYGVTLPLKTPSSLRWVRPPWRRHHGPAGCQNVHHGRHGPVCLPGLHQPGRL